MWPRCRCPPRAGTAIITRPIRPTTITAKNTLNAPLSSGVAPTTPRSTGYYGSRRIFVERGRGGAAGQGERQGPASPSDAAAPLAVAVAVAVVAVVAVVTMVAGAAAVVVVVAMIAVVAVVTVVTMVELAV